jgi:preprotein translocase subunit SecB
MKELIKLNDLFLTRVHVDWRPPNAKTKSPGDKPFIDYNIFRNKKNNRLFALVLIVRAHSGNPPKEDGQEIDAEIVGIFSFSKDATEEEMQNLIRINGLTILYGLLRGHLATMTGAFPGQKFILPSIYMNNIIPEVEQRRKEASVKKTRVSKKPLKKQRIQ